MRGELRVLAVDDERLALDDLAQLLSDHPDVSAVSTADSGVAALQALTRNHVDAVFLDVRMPDIDGIELGRVLKLFVAPPAIVFVSAYEGAAVAAFELRAADYLMKPVTRQRLSEALERVTYYTSVERPVDHVVHDQAEIDSHSEVLAVYMPRGNGVHLLLRSSILYLEAFGDYQRVFSTDGPSPARQPARPGAQMGAPRVRPSSPKVHSEPAARYRGAPTPDRRVDARLLRRQRGPDCPTPSDRSSSPSRALSSGGRPGFTVRSWQGPPRTAFHISHAYHTQAFAFSPRRDRVRRAGGSASSRPPSLHPCPGGSRAPAGAP